LKEAGYAVRFEEFDFPFFEERTAPVLLVSAPDRPQEPAPAGPVRTLANSGSGDVSAPLRAVRLGLEAGPPSASNSGCEARDFDGFELGAVALVRRGTCTFQTKVGNAAAAGAAGVVIMNEGTQGRTDVFTGQLTEAALVPVVGVSYELGRSLDARAGVVRLAVDAVRGRRRTRNVLADTAGDGEARGSLSARISTACRKGRASTTMAAARPRCLKRRCNWPRKPAAACASVSGARRSAP
jgi:hypothetical protein